MKIEIKNAPSQEVDWSKNMQIVKSIKGDRIVVTSLRSVVTGDKNSEGSIEFSGFDISDMSYSDRWLKSGFQPFNGEITLKND